MTEKNNLELWDKVEKTDPKHTKPITGKSYKGTSPKPQWLVRKATETFGPCGIGWGFTVDERIESGAAIGGGARDQMHIAKVTVWYNWNGERGEVTHVGGTPFSGFRSSGKPFTDEDAPKKSVTDALVKALSMIGFAGDIFMGRFDDSKYVEDTKAEFESGTAPPEKKDSSKAEARPVYEAMQMALNECDEVSLDEFDRWKKTQVSNFNLLPPDWQKTFGEQCAAMRESIVARTNQHMSGTH